MGSEPQTLAGFLALCLAVAGIGGAVTGTGEGSWYRWSGCAIGRPAGTILFFGLQRIGVALVDCSP